MLITIPLIAEAREAVSFTTSQRAKVNSLANILVNLIGEDALEKRIVKNIEKHLDRKSAQECVAYVGEVLMDETHPFSKDGGLEELAEHLIWHYQLPLKEVMDIIDVA